MCILTVQWFTCVFTATQKVLQWKEMWAGAPPASYLVVGHEQSTDGAVWLHSAHGCIILLLSHKVWGLRLPKMNQRLCPRLGFFHFLLNRWSLRQLWRERAWKHSQQGQFSSVHSLSHIQLFAAPRTAAHQASLSITNSQSTQTHVHWVGDAIQPSHPVIPFSFCPQSFPASGSFQMSQLSTSGGQCIGVWASASVPPMNTQDWSPLGWTGWISLQSKGLFNGLLQHHSSKASILRRSAFFRVQLSHPYMTTGKTIALARWTFVGKVMSLLFNMLSRLVITFLPRSKHLLISWLQSPSAVILEPQKIKAATVSTVSPSICHEVMEPNAMILVFRMLNFKPTFSLSFTFIKRLFSSSSLSAIRVVSSAYLRLLILLPAIMCFFQPSVSHAVLCI